MKKTLTYVLLPAFALVIMLVSCEDNYNFDMDKVSKTTEVETSLAFPLAYANLLLSDLIQEIEDTVLYKDDKSISIVFRRNNVFEYKVSDFFTIPSIDPPYEEEFNIGKLGIEDISLSNTLTMSDLGFQNQGTIAVFPGTPSATIGAFDFDNISTKFEYATFSSGQIVMSLTNNFPVAVGAGLNFKIVDKKEHNNVIAIFSFPDEIAPGATVQSNAVDLAGKEFSNEMQAILENYSLGSGTNITIDPTASGIDYTVDMTGIKVESGKAVISSKTLPKEKHEVDFGDMDDEIYYLSFTEGKITAKLWSYVAASVEVKITIPSFTKDGVVYERIIPVTETGNEPKIIEIDLAGYECNLTLGEEQNYNRLVVEYDIYNPTPTEYIEFSATDPIIVRLETTDLKMKEVRGKLKSQTIDIDEQKVDLDVDMLDVFDGGFKLTDPRINLYVRNSVGIPAAFNVDLLGIAYNRNQENLSVEHVLKAPTPENPYILDTIRINKNTSNVVEFIALPPAEIVFNASALVNPPGSENVLNFLSDTSQIQIDAEMELPFEFKTANLAIVDTAEISFEESLDMLDDGKIEIYVKAENGFPFDISLNLTPRELNDNGDLIEHETIEAQLLDAAPVDANGKVSEVISTYNKIELTLEEIENLLNSKDVIIHAKLMTTDNGNVAVKLYHDYSLYVKLGVKADGKTTINFDE